MIKFLRRNIDVFAWNAYESPRVDPEFICHHLKVNPLITLRKQPPRHPSKEHADELVKVTVGVDPKKFIQIGSQLPHQEKEELIEFFRRNIDVFAWNAYEAPGVDPEFIYHHLKVNPLITPRKQLQIGRAHV